MYIEDLDELVQTLWYQGLNEWLRNEWIYSSGKKLCERYGLLQEYDEDLPYYAPKSRDEDDL